MIKKILVVIIIIVAVVGLTFVIVNKTRANASKNAISQARIDIKSGKSKSDVFSELRQKLTTNRPINFRVTSSKSNAGVLRDECADLGDAIAHSFNRCISLVIGADGEIDEEATAASCDALQNFGADYDSLGCDLD